MNITSYLCMVSASTKLESRADGKSLLRSLMSADNSYENRLDQDVSEQEDPSEEFADGASDSEGHHVDHHFSSKQLKWIEMHYGNSEHFMMSYGLKYWDFDDADEAKALVEDTMAEDN